MSRARLLVAVLTLLVVGAGVLTWTLRPQPDPAPPVQR